MLLLGTLALAGCGGAPGYPRGPTQLGPTPYGAAPATGASNTVPAGRGVAILAPLSGPNADRGQALVRAAQLALAGAGAPKLDVRDTGGTSLGAAAAATAAIAGGAGLIIGPLTAAETAGAAGPALQANVPVLAFTNDQSQARPGVWVLGITPATQVRRLVGAMTAQGKTRFAAVLPQGEFGDAMGSALGQIVTGAGLPSPIIRFYAPGPAAADAAVRDVSDYAGRRGPLDAQIRAARGLNTLEGRRRAAELVRQPIPPAPFDALLLADSGDSLAAITSLLPYYDVDPPGVRVLGPALWASPAARGSATLRGAWYPAPDPAGRLGFDQRFTAAYGVNAPGIADFAYDAAAIAGALAQTDGFSAAALCRPSGYLGVDGLLVLQPDGTVRRGLALFEIQSGAPVMIEPSPESLNAPGI